MSAQEMNVIAHAEQADRVARCHGHLVIIGGGEDKQHDMAILRRFVELSGGPSAKIVVITAASAVTEHMWETHDRAFADLGVTRHLHLHLTSRHAANDEAQIRDILDADGIFMTGGDQKRLLAIIGGTSAGASALPGADGAGRCIPPPLLEFLENITKRNPIS
jgi:cyanophycinase